MKTSTCFTVLLISGLLALCAAPAPAQVALQKWVTRYDGPGDSEDLAYAVAVDTAGNVAVTGTSKQLPGNHYNYYTAKYAAENGALLWEKIYNRTPLPGQSYDSAFSVAMDGAGNVIVTGQSAGDNSYEYYTIKYAAADGSVLWDSRFGGAYGLSVAVDSAGDVAVTGWSFSLEGDNNFYPNYCTVKYAGADGAPMWRSDYNGPAHRQDEAHHVVVDVSGNVIVTGSSTNASGNKDYCTVKYAAASGALLWEKRYNGPADKDDVANTVAVDSAGNVAVTGSSTNADNSTDYYTAKYAAADGALLWEKRYNGPANDLDEGRSVGTDGDGNVAVTGTSISVAGGSDYYTAKYAAADGALLWEKRYDSGLSDEAFTVALDSTGNVVVTGQSRATSGQYDYYTAKYAGADGALLWEGRYDGPAHNDDSMTYSQSYAGKLALTADGGAVVTGASSNGSDYDYATVRYAPDTVTQPPVLNAPQTGTTTGSPVAVSYTLPERAGTGTVELTFDDGVSPRILHLTGESAAPHNFNFNPANPSGTSAGAVASGPVIPDGTYTVSLSYQDVLLNPRASAVSTAVTVRTLPTVSIGAASNITGNGATLNGAVNPGGVMATALFEYGLSASYGSTVTVTLSPDDGTAAQVVSATLAGLAEGTEYHYRLAATNASGTARSADATFTTLAAEIAVEQPVGTNVLDGGSRNFGPLVTGQTASLTFSIKNSGAVSLTGLGITKNGTAEFAVTANPAAPVLPGDSTNFTVVFAPTTGGAKTAVLHIASNDADESPFDITLTGTALSYSTDSDGDGLNDASEFQMAALGFDWQVGQPALVNTYYANANGAGLYSTSQVQALNVGTPLLTRNSVTGMFKLTLALQKAANLTTFAPFPFPDLQTVINGEGKIEIEFTVPDNAAFFRVEAQ